MKKRLIKRNKYLTIIIMIFLILLTSVETYLVLTKLPKKNDKEEAKTNKIELTQNIENKLMEQIETYNKYLSLNYPINNITDLDNQKILLFGYLTIIDKIENNSFNLELLEESLNNQLEIENIKYEDIICPIDKEVLYKYDETSKTYTFNGTHPHGGVGSSKTKSYYIDGYYQYETDTYVVSVKTIYQDYCSDGCEENNNYYKTSIDAYRGTNKIVNEKQIDEAYEEIKETLQTTTYTFQKASLGNYKLKNVNIK